MSTLVANNIINQIGNKALTMIGAKNLGAGNDSLSFKIGRNPKKVTHVTIKLNSKDLYDIDYVNIREFNPIKVIAKVNDISCDMLQQSIKNNTGLEVTL